MASLTPSLICNFTLQSSLNLGVSFESADGGMSYGGLVTIFTPASAGPVTTGLWDSDGNVFFTIYLQDGSGGPTSTSCTINSGSRPGTFEPDVQVQDQSGLTCVISEPTKGPGNVYDYTLTITAA